MFKDSLASPLVRLEWVLGAVSLQPLDFQNVPVTLETLILMSRSLSSVPGSLLVGNQKMFLNIL